MKIGDSPILFISYKSHDVDFVRPICERLLAEGYSPWFNEYDVPFERVDEFQRCINRGIDEASWGLLFANDRYTLSPYCNIEVERLLRRLPPERLFVFHIEPSMFAGTYPELDNRQFVCRDRSDVLKCLADAGIIGPRQADYGPPPPVAANPWLLKDISAQISPLPWQVDPGSLLRRAGRLQWLDVTGEERADYHSFEAHLDGRPVRLWVDYRRIEKDQQASLDKRTTTWMDGAIRILEDDEDDRRRLREELENFSHEAAAIQDIVTWSSPAGKGADRIRPIFTAIGVHMFNTTDGQGAGRNSYKHRLFSFQLEDRIYRVYKLTLPQPQLLAWVAVRFVFEFEDDIRAFFASLPYCDRVVKSFAWMNPSTQPSLSLADVRAARDRARGKLP